MKIYSKTGDKGETSLFGGTRVPKYHFRIESYGTIDELNSWLGLLRDQEIDPHSRETLLAIQEQLFTVGATLATAPDKAKLRSRSPRKAMPHITDRDIALLEEEMDVMEVTLPPLTHFILPGGNSTVSYCHIARTVCRRAERLATYLHSQEPMDEKIMVYINRLSDYLFVLARKLAQDLKADEIKWIPGKEG